MLLQGRLSPLVTRAGLSQKPLPPRPRLHNTKVDIAKTCPPSVRLRALYVAISRLLQEGCRQSVQNTCSIDLQRLE